MGEYNPDWEPIAKREMAHKTGPVGSPYRPSRGAGRASPAKGTSASNQGHWRRVYCLPG
jgi:hypothetical protein